MGHLASYHQTAPASGESVPQNHAHRVVYVDALLKGTCCSSRPSRLIRFRFAVYPSLWMHDRSPQQISITLCAAFASDLRAGLERNSGSQTTSASLTPGRISCFLRDDHVISHQRTPERCISKAGVHRPGRKNLRSVSGPEYGSGKCSAFWKIAFLPSARLTMEKGRPFSTIITGMARPACHCLSGWCAQRIRRFHLFIFSDTRLTRARMQRPDLRDGYAQLLSGQSAPCLRALALTQSRVM